MQEQVVPMGKRKFRIGDLAQELKLKKYIIRFWEKEFDLKSDRSDGGQRFYTEEDFALFSNIKKLLYDEGFTIAGARKQLGIDTAHSPALSSGLGKLTSFEGSFVDEKTQKTTEILSLVKKELLVLKKMFDK